jgi:hypothetical protein
VLAAERQLYRLENEEVIDADTETQDSEITQVHESSRTDVEMRRIELVCSGGLFLNHTDFYEAFDFQLRRKRDFFRPVRLTEPASLGAMALGEEAPEKIAV